MIDVILNSRSLIAIAESSCMLKINEECKKSNLETNGTDTKDDLYDSAQWILETSLSLGSLGLGFKSYCMGWVHFSCFSIYMYLIQVHFLISPALLPTKHILPICSPRPAFLEPEYVFSARPTLSPWSCTDTNAWDERRNWMLSHSLSPGTTSL